MTIGSETLPLLPKHPHMSTQRGCVGIQHTLPYLGQDDRNFACGIQFTSGKAPHFRQRRFLQIPAFLTIVSFYQPIGCGWCGISD